MKPSTRVDSSRCAGERERPAYEATQRVPRVTLTSPKAWYVGRVATGPR